MTERDAFRHVAKSAGRDLPSCRREEMWATVLRPGVSAGQMRVQQVARAGRLPLRPRSRYKRFMDDAIRERTEAAAFRALVAHLRERTDVQNLDLMNLAGFCRNCLAKWYRAAAQERGVELSDPDARALVYGMPYEEWKQRYQR